MLPEADKIDMKARISDGETPSCMAATQGLILMVNILLQTEKLHAEAKDGDKRR